MLTMNDAVVRHIEHPCTTAPRLQNVTVVRGGLIGLQKVVGQETWNDAIITTARVASEACI